MLIDDKYDNILYSSEYVKYVNLFYTDRFTIFF